MQRNHLIKKFVIGSANFTQKYGADLKQINNIEIRKILKIAKKNNISKIDTAESYIKNKNVFNSIDKKFSFFSKIKPNSKWESLKYCQKKIEKHFQIFNNCKFETLLIHDIKILFTKSGQKIFKNLEKLKERKHFKKIGISIYDTKSLDYLIYKYKFDVVQCPYYIFDRRIIHSEITNELRNRNIILQVRSIFLQGLLLMNIDSLPTYFDSWSEHMTKWDKFNKSNKLNAIESCISFIKNQNLIDEVVVGINNLKQLKEIYNYFTKKNKIYFYDELANNDLGLIDPRNWKV